MSQPSFTITGTVHAILAKEQRGRFDVQRFVLEVEGYKDRKELAVFELFGEKCDRLEAFREGDTAEVTFNISGREHNGKFYTNLSAWKIVKPERNGEPEPEREYRHKADRFSRPPARERSATAGGAYRGKNAYNPPHDDGEDYVNF